ncbi:MAG: class B sortase [Atopobiaceae bacterium]|nr:class B sortase [Atopobiaceae bacterium]MBR3315569.1 class B sortase [Atopobiaceae bacterium]
MSEGTGRKVIRAISTWLNRALMVVLCLPLAMGCYALWDSHVVYERANVGQWQPYKPTEPEPLSFWELQRINPEVCAWLSVYGTNIDYPVCRAADGDQDKYLTADAKGEYSLSGALFVDVANSADFDDFATIVYGHHMENDVMFGQLTDFADGEFFDEHRYGNLFVSDTNLGLDFFCYLDADAYDRDIYRHAFSGPDERTEYLDLLRKRAKHVRDDARVSESDHIVLLSTCAAGSTNARAILVGKVCQQRFKNPFVKVPNLGTGVDAREGWLGVPVWCWAALAALVALVIVLVWMRKTGKATHTDG